MAPRSASAKALLILAAGLRPGSCLRSRNSISEEEAGRGRDRYVFVAGLPGTGLEFWQGVFRGCVDGGVCETRETSFYTSVMFQQHSEDDLLQAWTKKRPILGRLVPLNLISPNTDRLPDSVFSHPFNVGPSPGSGGDPRLDVYAQVAQQANDSFKVLVLTRHNETDLLANVMRRTKTSASEAEEKMVKAVEKLAAQVEKLPKGSFRCQRYEDTAAVSEHLAPLIQKNEGDSQAFAESVRVTNGKLSQGCSKRKKDCLPAPKLRIALNELEGLCPAPDIDHWTSQANLDKVLNDKIHWLLS
mmetsp:Transcript_112108/g.349400  ORF Transcript_112108/g.349400 Transcript_112108/m.349400 type:complete len:301 (-) Transcript_112108:90-992(-)|eukprot:CAMPEP_0204602514 /NCGR_PEP_ID=MMETSP0661-20131031/56684_1 /ASSEMBLY_ACC=CAM_ASM_000606 /TAXON_ID=109239 /ORGANISM="Alexandrium margalefi, Strain AMGDE01CS-322" /LENGTH=300 /DNA_ID=CAMNT_0051613479 /DNA_START=68 /DNA_END=970 /DNA_ORIENTATION=+